MQHSTLEEIMQNAPGFRSFRKTFSDILESKGSDTTGVQLAHKITNSLLQKVRTSKIKNFLQLTTVNYEYEIVGQPFLFSAVLKAINQSFGEGMNCFHLKIRKDALLAHDIPMKSREELNAFCETFKDEIPQLADIRENGNGLEDDIIFFILTYDYTIPLIGK